MVKHLDFAVTMTSIMSCDSFIISSIKDEWMAMWGGYKFNDVKSAIRKDNGRADGHH